MKKGQIVAVSSLSSGVLYGVVIIVEPKRIAVNVGGNTIWAEKKNVTRIWDKMLIEKLKAKY